MKMLSKVKFHKPKDVKKKEKKNEEERRNIKSAYKVFITPAYKLQLVLRPLG